MPVIGNRHFDHITHSFYHSFEQAMQAFSPWESEPHLAVACSGGMDSMALVLAAHHWTADRGGRVTALIVDHGIRKESHAEAGWVSSVLATHSIISEIITLLPLPVGNLQAEARRARYATMESWCRQHHVLHVLVGHHRGDQRETCVMRLLRGAGPDGLAVMAGCAETRQLRILRPLLHSERQDYTPFLQMHGMPWVEDPSNQKEQFTRVQVRNMLAQTLRHDQITRLDAVIEQFGSIRAIAHIHMATLMARYVTLFNCGAIWINAELLAQPDDVLCPMLERMLSCIDGDADTPRRQELERLCRQLVQQPDKTATLHRCLLMPHRMQSQAGWLIMRELRHAQPAIELTQEAIMRWDRRFDVRLLQPHSQALSLAAVGEEGWKQLKATGWTSSKWPRALIMQLPAIRSLEGWMQIPHIRWGNVTDGHPLAHIRFVPSKSLVEPPFCIMNKESIHH